MADTTNSILEAVTFMVQRMTGKNKVDDLLCFGAISALLDELERENHLGNKARSEGIAEIKRYSRNIAIGIDTFDAIGSEAKLRHINLSIEKIRKG